MAAVIAIAAVVSVAGSARASAAWLFHPATMTSAAAERVLGARRGCRSQSHFQSWHWSCSDGMNIADGSDEVSPRMSDCQTRTKRVCCRMGETARRRRVRGGRVKVIEIERRKRRRIHLLVCFLVGLPMQSTFFLGQVESCPLLLLQGWMLTHSPMPAKKSLHVAAAAAAVASLAKQTTRA